MKAPFSARNPPPLLPRPRFLRRTRPRLLKASSSNKDTCAHAKDAQGLAAAIILTLPQAVSGPIARPVCKGWPARGSKLLLNSHLQAVEIQVLLPSGCKPSHGLFLFLSRLTSVGVANSRWLHSAVWSEVPRFTGPSLFSSLSSSTVGF